MTFKLDIQTADDLAQEALQKAKDDARAECRNRIVAVCDETAQLNLAAAVAAGMLTAEQVGIYRIGLGWVDQLRNSWEGIAVEGRDPQDDANWPAVPPGVTELASAF